MFRSCGDKTTLRLKWRANEPKIKPAARWNGLSLDVLCGRAAGQCSRLLRSWSSPQRRRTWAVRVSRPHTRSCHPRSWRRRSATQQGKRKSITRSEQQQISLPLAGAVIGFNAGSPGRQCPDWRSGQSSCTWVCCTCSYLEQQGAYEQRSRSFPLEGRTHVCFIESTSDPCVA